MVPIQACMALPSRTFAAANPKEEMNMERLFRFAIRVATIGFFVWLPLTAWSAEVRTPSPTIINAPAAVEKTNRVAKPANPDLVISNINFSPAKPTADDEITFWVFVKNVGTEMAGPSKLQFRIGGESDPALASVPALPPGKEYRFTRKYKPGKAQNYLATATADYTKEVSESNETNNVLEKGFSVTEGLIPQGLNVHIKSVLWSRASKTWVATIRNDGSVAAKISISGFPLENGAPGMTFWVNDVNLAPNQETQLSGDYRNFEVPPGTRLKVHVILKPSGAKLDEKIIVMD